MNLRLNYNPKQGIFKSLINLREYLNHPPFLLLLLRDHYPRIGLMWWNGIFRIGSHGVVDMTFFDYLSIVSYTLTALGYIMTNIFWLRIYMLIACIMDVGIYLFIRPGNPLWVQVVMNILFVLINGFSLFRLILDRLPPRFHGEIGELYTSVFNQLIATEFKLLLSISEWKTIAPNVLIIREGETNINLMVICEGKVEIQQNGISITTIGKGSLLGEINFLTDIPPKNNVITLENTRLFILPKEKLVRLLDRNSGIKTVIYSILGCNIASKLKLMTEEKTLGQAVT